MWISLQAAAQRNTIDDDEEEEEEEDEEEEEEERLCSSCPRVYISAGSGAERQIDYLSELIHTRRLRYQRAPDAPGLVSAVSP
ncbi:hypothetical protein PHYPO_G00209860 [Pangasianodon hypophthalmus]|uniref:Uncharacterized protein n=1 Tax=Pangasianodon hypophthalmus TaxID=310915 RepID=A0A5N5PCV3_PANHP|nr:hypothetical protein PHYPO_G00209860 [Pangasianodon hypophthalmus]